MLVPTAKDNREGMGYIIWPPKAGSVVVLELIIFIDLNTPSEAHSTLRYMYTSKG